jgi:trans-2,3-dihydro-3-hydroxyanthranilate isomerase
MPASFRFVTLDVFTDRQFAGNPLAVFPEAEGLTAEQMQQLAAEMNLSETCFLLPPEDPANHARLRIFHRTAEMPFAGHPTIGSAFVLASERLPQATILRLEVPAGLARADILRNANGRVVGARIDAPKALETYEEYAPAEIAACLGLQAGDIVTSTHPPVRASTGVEFILVEISLAALERVAPVIDAFRRLAARGGHRDRYSLFVYARREAEDGSSSPLQVEARMFAPLSGTWEDPGTGSASSILGALLLQHSPEAELSIRSRQGFAMGRTCTIDIKAWRTGGDICASVGGQCVTVLAGHYASLENANEAS